MNKILLSLVSIVFASSSAVATELTILNTGSESGSAAALTTALSSDFQGSDFQNPGKHCVAINSNLVTIDGPVLFPWFNDLEAPGRDGEGCATVSLTPDQAVAYTTSSLFVCAMDEKNFLTVSGKVGHSTPAHAYARLVSGVNQSFGTSHISIDYNGSGDARSALLSGETDYFVGTGKHAKRLMKKGAICSYNSGPEGLISLDSSNSDLQLEFTTILVVKNADATQTQQIKDMIKRLYLDKNTAFGTLTNSGNDITFYFDESIFDRFENSVTKMQK